MNMNELPQIRASSTSIGRGRRVISNIKRERSSACEIGTRRTAEGFPSRRRPPIHCPSELGRGTTPHEARSHRLGVRSYPRTARTIAERLRARGVLAPVVRALWLQALGAAATATAVERR